MPWRQPAKPKTQRQLCGRQGEGLAADYLKAQGYRILKTNARYPVGEIDIVAREGDTLCFVEVRSTASDAWGGPLATVTWAKQRKIIRAARWYLAGRKAEPLFIRFDVLGILWADPTHPQIELIRNAFDAS